MHSASIPKNAKGLAADRSPAAIRNIDRANTTTMLTSSLSNILTVSCVGWNRFTADRCSGVAVSVMVGLGRCANYRLIQGFHRYNNCGRRSGKTLRP
jgi:hypothetical protein